MAREHVLAHGAGVARSAVPPFRIAWAAIVEPVRCGHVAAPTGEGGAIGCPPTRQQDLSSWKHLELSLRAPRPASSRVLA
jgi:hypothetical protein